MVVWSNCGMVLTGGNRSTGKRTCHIATLSTTNPTSVDVGNALSYGIVQTRCDQNYCLLGWHRSFPTLKPLISKFVPLLRFSGTFANFQKANVRFVILAVFPFVCPLGTNRIPLDVFSRNLLFQKIFGNLLRKIQVSLNSDNNSRYFTCRPIYILIISRSVRLRMRNVSDKSFRENQNTHFVFSDIFFENCAVYEIMWEKYFRAVQVSDDSVIRRWT